MGNDVAVQGQAAEKAHISAGLKTGGGNAMKILCALIGHRRRKAKIWHDTADWRAECSRCGIAMIRDHRTRKWRSFRPSDASPNRKGAPLSGTGRNGHRPK